MYAVIDYIKFECASDLSAYEVCTNSSDPQNAYITGFVVCFFVPSCHVTLFETKKIKIKKCVCVWCVLGREMFSKFGVSNTLGFSILMMILLSIAFHFLGYYFLWRNTQVGSQNTFKHFMARFWK